MQPLDVAFHYVSTGWPVFPCRPAAEDVPDPNTGEIETKKEKTPYTSNGLKGATRYERIVRRWWSDTPQAMIGVPTGAPIGAWVLDIDVPPDHEDGRIWLAAMEELHGPLPETRTATTASGGKHYFWRHVDGVRNRAGKSLGLGVDTRGDGGFIIAPGSVMLDGRGYEWDNDLPIADAPSWLLELVLPRAINHVAQPLSYTAGTNDHYVNRAVDDELQKLAGTSQGGRGHALNASAFSLGQLVGAGALSRSDAEAGLYNAAMANGSLQTDGERETLAKIKRGLEAGARQPREIPEHQDNTRLVDISRMISNGLKKARDVKPDYTTRLEAEPERAEDDAPTEDDAPPIGDVAANDNEPAGPITATAFKWIDPSTLPRREFAYGKHLIRKYVSVTVSPGGLGKTALSLAESLAMTSGRALLGIKPSQRLRVWVFNAEDPRDEMERRIMAACIHYGLKPADIEGHLFLDSGREQELVVAIEDKKAGVVIREPIVEAVVEQIERYGIDVMIVDPFVSTHGVNENDNGAIDKVAKLWAQIADHTNCAIDIVHHLRKVADREATVEDARGAVSLIGAARSVRVLNRMSQEQADQAGLSGEDRFGYFSVTYGKSNLTPLSSHLDWRHLVSVPLGNARGLSKPQDFAPVVAEWKWPSSEEIAQDVTAEQREAIRVAVSNSDFKPSPRAKNWAGLAVAYAMGLDAEDDTQRKRAGTVLRALLKEGVLVEVEERDAVRREAAKFVRAA
ncbi:bifunctional DNA primase/polymerase [Rhizobium rhizogenes]|uniref:bifunctional DNA primase/polymerase n=1 Tax=Rhizobium rhizogenes TaxID=359 RepID=UPI001F285739|nr:bifunctional DNA primase/polymerase [Rhizobium rhizogenes]